MCNKTLYVRDSTFSLIDIPQKLACTYLLTFNNSFNLHTSHLFTRFYIDFCVWTITLSVYHSTYIHTPSIHSTVYSWCITTPDGKRLLLILYYYIFVIVMAHILLFIHHTYQYHHHHHRHMTSSIVNSYTFHAAHCIR